MASETGNGADDRPQYQHGVGVINGTQFHWGSGTPGKYWSIPYGDYPVTPNAPTGAWAHQVGAIPINNNIIPDPVLHRNRVGIMVHPSSGSGADLDALYTQGCFAVAPQEWPGVRQQILDEASKGPLYLHVQPGQAAAFSHTPTLAQAGAPPADQSPPGGGTATAAAAPSAGSREGFLDALTRIESNNQNIFSRVDKDYPGQPGSRSQGYAQIDTPTWQQFGAKAGIDLTKYPNAMSAPRDVQTAVASQIPLSRFGARTQRMLGQEFGQLDTSKTIGQLASTVPGTTLTSAPSGASTAVAGGQAAAPAAGAAAPAAGAPGQAQGGLLGFQPGSGAEKSMQAGLRTLGGGGGGFGGGGGQDQTPEPMRLQQAPQAMAMGGPMMLAPGGQNTMGARAAQNYMAQLGQAAGFATSPTLAYGGADPAQSGLASSARSSLQSAPIGSATGMGMGLPGTTLNSPGQLQMALMTGAMNPYDLYGGGQSYGYGSS